MSSWISGFVLRFGSLVLDLFIMCNGDMDSINLHHSNFHSDVCGSFNFTKTKTFYGVTSGGLPGATIDMYAYSLL